MSPLCQQQLLQPPLHPQNSRLHLATSTAGSKKISIHPDGYAWVKYGEKKLTPSKMVREYYRCKSWRDTGAGGMGCPAKKVVDRPYFDDEGSEGGGEKKSTRAVFPRHSPCQSPEYSQHNHPALVPPSSSACGDIGCSPPTPTASQLGCPLLNKSSTLYPQHPTMSSMAPCFGAPSYMMKPSVAATSPMPEDFFSSCLRALVANNAGQSTNSFHCLVKKEPEGSAQSPSGSLKRPSLPPLLIPESHANSLRPASSSFLATLERTVCSGYPYIASQPTQGERTSALFSAAAALLLNQQQEAKRCQEEEMQEASTLLLQRLLQPPMQHAKRQRLYSPSGQGPPAGSLSPSSMQQSEVLSSPPPPMFSDGNALSASLSGATSSGATGDMATPSSAAASRTLSMASGTDIGAASLALSELPDDALLSLLDFLSGQLATSLESAKPTQAAVLAALLQ